MGQENPPFNQDLLGAQEKLYRAHVDAGRKLNEFEKSGPLGLTSEKIRATPEWQSAKRAHESAFSALQAFNQRHGDRLKKIGLAERMAYKRGAKNSGGRLVGKVEGEKGTVHAGRKPRGRAAHAR